MANEITLSVNGTKQVVSAAPETPLLFVQHGARPALRHPATEARAG
jgi:hypothetical protein